jgi:hypothetical protein
MQLRTTNEHEWKRIQALRIPIKQRECDPLFGKRPRWAFERGSRRLACVLVRVHSWLSAQQMTCPFILDVCPFILDVRTAG